MNRIKQKISEPSKKEEESRKMLEDLAVAMEAIESHMKENDQTTKNLISRIDSLTKEKNDAVREREPIGGNKGAIVFTMTAMSLMYILFPNYPYLLSALFFCIAAAYFFFIEN